MSHSACASFDQRYNREGGHGHAGGGAVSWLLLLLLSINPRTTTATAAAVQVQNWQLTQIDSFEVDLLGLGNLFQVYPLEVHHLGIGQGDRYPHSGLLVFGHRVNNLWRNKVMQNQGSKSGHLDVATKGQGRSHLATAGPGKVTLWRCVATLPATCEGSCNPCTCNQCKPGCPHSRDNVVRNR